MDLPQNKTCKLKTKHLFYVVIDVDVDADIHQPRNAVVTTDRKILNKSTRLGPTTCLFVYLFIYLFIYWKLKTFQTSINIFQKLFQISTTRMQSPCNLQKLKVTIIVNTNFVTCHCKSLGSKFRYDDFESKTST